MHEDELEIDEALVRSLLAVQHPRWAEEPLQRVASGGTVNAIYRLGSRLCVRLPLQAAFAEDLDVLERWVPMLAADLEVEVPTIVARGHPSDAFPAPWSVQRWIDGDPFTLDGLAEPVKTAEQLGRIVARLQRQEVPLDAPRPRVRNFFKGVDLALRDTSTRTALENLRRDRSVDVARAAEAWERAMAVPSWGGPPRWLHADLMPGNLLLRDGRLTGVLDWGCAVVGDPAYDCMAAWMTLAADVRPTFRAHVAVDGDTWDRARGLALHQAVMALDYYGGTNPAMVANGRATLQAVLDDLC
jgi:aminoglycoside phosphotransferase (APT) family kinase protein